MQRKDNSGCTWNEKDEIEYLRHLAAGGTWCKNDKIATPELALRNCLHSILSGQRHYAPGVNVSKITAEARRLLRLTEHNRI